MKRLLHGILEVARGRVMLGLVLTAVLAGFEAAAIATLVPLLKFAGVAMEGSAGGVDAWVAGAFDRLAISPSFLSTLILYVLIVLVAATLGQIKYLNDTSAIHAYGLALRTRVYEAIARAEWIALSRLRSSDVTFAITSAVDEAESGAHDVLSLTGTGAIALAYTVMALIVSPVMTAVVLGTAFVIMSAERARTLLGRARGADVTTATSQLYATAAEQLGGLKTAKSYGNEGHHLDLFISASRNVNDARFALARAFAKMRWRMAIGSVLALSGVLYLAVAVVKLPAAETLLLVFVFSRLVPRLAEIQQTVQRTFSRLPALTTIASLVERLEAAPERHSGAQRRIDLGEAVKLDGVSFSYDGSSNHQQLQRVDLTIPAGATTAIVGPSGAGKSTIADMLLGLLKPSEGRVLIDGVALDPAHLGSWRAQIAYVAQDTFLFNESIRFNLQWAREGATEAQMGSALEKASAGDLVRSLPDGLDTLIGERGIRLSGGERQRLSLARAILREPRLLILDEATNALDSENEDRIFRAIQALQGQTTIVIITHRLTAIRSADMIHVIEQGKLIASGDWDAVMGGTHSRLRELSSAAGIPVGYESPLVEST